MSKQQHTNRSLAAAAGISEGAVRNLLKFGVEEGTKDPDARTLRRVADALGVNPLRLFLLAGYLPPNPDSHSVRADFVADVFDRLSYEKQEAVLGVLDAMADNYTVRETVNAIRENRSLSLAGMDISQPRVARMVANQLIAKYQMVDVYDIDRIEPDVQISGWTWSQLPHSTQQRVLGLIRHKLLLDYDPTMVDPEWRT